MTWLGDLGSDLLGALYAYRVVVLVGSVAAAVALAAVARRRGWIGLARRHPRAAVEVLIPLLVVVLPVGWYLTSPLVLSASIDEPPPIVAAATITPQQPPRSAVPSSTAPRPGPSQSPVASAAPAATPPTLITRVGSFEGSDDFHFGRGTARLIEVAPGSFVVRLENFAVRNGPDLYVYLSPNARGYTDDAIELGRLKADRGNQNYAVPAGALSNPDRAASVVIWCKQFSHLFATATLAS